MAHQPSIFPEFVRAGVIDELAREGLFSMGNYFRKTQDGEVVAGRRFEKGEKALLLLPQWRFREILRRRVGGYADAEVKVGWRVKGIEGGVERVRGRYIAGANGPRSCQVAVRDRVRGRDVAGAASCDGC